jgi:FkbM family methyltransferase
VGLESPVSGWRRRLLKLFRLLRTPRFRRALRVGVAAADEHRSVLAPLSIGTVIDAGANKGQFALLALELYPAATVHAFEPLPAGQARMAVWARQEPRLIRHQIALGAAAGTATLHIAARDDNSSLRQITDRQVALFPGTHQTGVLAVSVDRLDNCLTVADLTAPVLLKIDVQGAELEVLEGGGALLEAVDWVYVECSFLELYAGQALAGTVIARLNDAGFSRYATGPMICDAAGAPVQADLLFRADRVKSKSI